MIVHCSDAGWAQTLTMMAADLAARLAEVLPGEAPRSLRFRVGTVAPADGRTAAAALAGRRAQAAAELAAPIADERLRPSRNG